jgi:DNA-binding LacI/PurR family transcriptional regulator
VPRPDIGRISAELIVARLEGRQDVPRRVDVGFDIAVREST